MMDGAQLLCLVLLWSFALAAAAQAEEAASPVVLRSPQLEVVLDREDGLPYMYRLLPSNVQVWGKDQGGKIGVRLFRREPRDMVTFRVAPSSARASETKAFFQFDVTYQEQPAASFGLRYALDNTSVTVSLEEIQELAGFELIHVEIPALATVHVSEGPAWLAYPERGGQWVDLSRAQPARLRMVADWRFQAPVAMIGTPKAIAVLETPSYLDTTEVSVTPARALHADGGSEADNRRASLGATKAVRVPGGEKTPNLRVEQASLCRVTILGNADGDVDWLDGAKFVRQHVPKIPSRYYDGKFVYKIFCDSPGRERPVTTFEEAGLLIHDIAALTGNWPQVAYLVGWQYKGHDTGYPAVDVVNERLGGYNGLMRLMEEARKVNCVVSFHDNYDDAYPSSPAWDEALIAKGRDGALMKGGVWAGGQCYIIGMARYMAGPGRERVRYTCERYKIRDTYHIDVLSALPLRHNWDPDYPASAVGNLRGKYAILDAFAARGVGVTSEGLSWPFIGKMSYFWHGPRGRANRFGAEVPIPLVATLYRQSAVWGGVQDSDGVNVLESLFYNCTFCSDLRSGTERQWLTDAFYLLWVPWFKLHNRDIETFRREGDRTIIGFGEGTGVDLDWKKVRYSVTVDGVEVARDFSTFCQLDEQRMAFYSREARELRAPLPAGWEGTRISATALSVDRKPVRIPVTCVAGQVRLSVLARRPVMVLKGQR